MNNSHSESYAAAGVDIEAGYKGVQLMKKHVERTMIPGVVSGIGGFGGLFSPDVSDMKEPILVSGTDGVGTKIRVAQLMGKHDPEKVASMVSGVAEGCVQAGCALIGGETAEHPGVMNPNDYDLAGFAVGIVDKEKMIDPSMVKPGDVILALPSSGLHSNGFSLVRKVFDIERADLSKPLDELDGRSLGDELLSPTKIYVKPVLAAMEAAQIHGVSHITGGGFYENIPRCLPGGLSAKIDKSSLQIPPIFSLLQKTGDIPERDMFNTFNMGAGMVLVVDKEDMVKAITALDGAGQRARVIGEVVPGDGGVELL